MDENLEISKKGCLKFTVDKMLPKDLSTKLSHDLLILENKRRSKAIKEKAKKAVVNVTGVNKTVEKVNNSEDISAEHKLQEYYAIKEQEKTLERYDIRVLSYLKTLYINTFHFNLRKTYVMDVDK